jgi:hypothetical protein
MTSFGEVKPHVRFYGMLKNPAVYERDALSAKFTDISHCFTTVSLLGFARKLWWINQE